jgi:Flp pilus assembly protein TadG
MNRIKRIRGRRRRGLAAVELAVISPVLILILMGIIEFGWLFFFKQAITTATRVAARYATLPGATTANVTQRVHDTMNNMNLTQATYQYTVTVTRSTSGNPFERVEMSVPYNRVTIVGNFFSWLNITTIRASSSFRRESDTG